MLWCMWRLMFLHHLKCKSVLKHEMVLCTPLPSPFLSEFQVFPEDMQSLLTLQSISLCNWIISPLTPRSAASRFHRTCLHPCCYVLWCVTGCQRDVQVWNRVPASQDGPWNAVKWVTSAHRLLTHAISCLRLKLLHAEQVGRWYISGLFLTSAYLLR